MLRKDSCWPAKLAVGRSSAVAELRTARLTSSPYSSLKRAVAVQDLGGQVVGKSGAVDDLPGALGLPRQVGDVVGVEVVEFGVQAIPGACLVQHVAIGRRR